MRKVYFDISMKSNPGSGFWTCVAYQGNKKLFGNTGKIELETSNRAKIIAFLGAIRSLELRIEPIEHYAFVTNYKVLHDAINQGWIQQWELKGWKNSAGKDIENKDLWEQVLKYCENHKIHILWEDRTSHRFKYSKKNSKKLNKKNS